MLFMPSCQEVSRRVSESMDRDLPLRQRFSLRLHLLMCSLCSQFRNQMLFLRDLAHSFGQASEEDKLFGKAALSPETRARIKEALQHHGQ